MQELIDKIRQIVHVNDTEINLISNSFEARNYASRAYIHNTGRVCKEVHFIKNGLVRVFHLREEEEITSYLACDNGFVSSYSSFINQTPSFESIQCLEPTVTLSITFQKMQNLYMNVPCWEKVGRILAEQNFLCISDRLLKLQTVPAKEKYLNFLQTAPPKIVQRTPSIHVASFLGIKPESLSRIRKEIIS